MALLVLQHQADVQNLITRLSYDARTAADKREEPLEDTVERLLRMMLFVDAVEYTAPISGDAEVRRAVREPRGARCARADRCATSTSRGGLFRYPLSYVIYSPCVRCAAGRREERLLSAPERGAHRCRHERGLRALERRRSRLRSLAILRDTKPDFAAGVAN